MAINRSSSGTGKVDPHGRNRRLVDSLITPLVTGVAVTCNFAGDGWNVGRSQ